MLDFADRPLRPSVVASRLNSGAEIEPSAAARAGRHAADLATCLSRGQAPSTSASAATHHSARAGGIGGLRHVCQAPLELGAFPSRSPAPATTRGAPRFRHALQHHRTSFPASRSRAAMNSPTPGPSRERLPCRPRGCPPGAQHAGRKLQDLGDPTCIAGTAAAAQRISPSRSTSPRRPERARYPARAGMLLDLAAREAGRSARGTASSARSRPAHAPEQM